MDQSQQKVLEDFRGRWFCDPRLTRPAANHPRWSNPVARMHLRYQEDDEDDDRGSSDWLDVRLDFDEVVNVLLPQRAMDPIVLTTFGQCLAIITAAIEPVFRSARLWCSFDPKHSDKTRVELEGGMFVSTADEAQEKLSAIATAMQAIVTRFGDLMESSGEGERQVHA